MICFDGLFPFLFAEVFGTDSVAPVLRITRQCWTSQVNVELRYFIGTGRDLKWMRFVICFQPI